MGRSMSTKSSLHPLKDGAINVNCRSDGFLVRKINFEVLEHTSENYPVWEIYTWNEQVFRKHEIDDESRNVNFNASQKAINEKRGTTTGVTIFS